MTSAKTLSLQQVQNHKGTAHEATKLLLFTLFCISLFLSVENILMVKACIEKRIGSSARALNLQHTHHIKASVI